MYSEILKYGKFSFEFRGMNNYRHVWPCMVPSASTDSILKMELFFKLSVQENIQKNSLFRHSGQWFAVAIRTHGSNAGSRKAIVQDQLKSS